MRVKVGRRRWRSGTALWFLAKICGRGSERSPTPDRRRGFTQAPVQDDADRPVRRRESTSTPDVAAERRACAGSLEALACGDFGGAFSSYDPSIEWCTAADEPDHEAHRGIPDWRPWSSRWPSPGSKVSGTPVTFEGFIDGGRLGRRPVDRAGTRKGKRHLDRDQRDLRGTQVHNARIVRRGNTEPRSKPSQPSGLPRSQRGALTRAPSVRLRMELPVRRC